MPNARAPDRRMKRHGDPAPPRMHVLPRRTHALRTLGMGLGGLPVAMVLTEIEGPWWSWAWAGFVCLLWPHLAYWLARRSGDSLRAELRNLMLDSVFAGSLVPLMHFNVLPSVVLLAVVVADKISSGIRGLWLRALPGMLLAIPVVGLSTGFAFAPETSMPVLLACLPILVIHTIAVAASTYRLVRRVQLQNQQLDALNRVDSLTGLGSRGHWQAQAEALLQRHEEGGGAASLILIDVDHFKEINDGYGHAVGDDVLRAIADVIRTTLRATGHAGRLGGDEFVVAFPADLSTSAQVAERLRAGVEALLFPRNPGLRCTLSIGLAEAPAAALGLREWLEAADRALYRAKAAGRNRATTHEVEATVRR